MISADAQKRVDELCAKITAEKDPGKVVTLARIGRSSSRQRARQRGSKAMTMRYAAGDSPVFTRMVIQEETSPGNATAILQNFPVAFVPRIGETVAIEGERGTFKVVDVWYSFVTSPENRQVVMVTVRRESS
jgi:hypothetical protein